MKKNDYYSIACEDLKYLQCTLGTPLYNNIAVGAQQVTEKMIKSLAEHTCVGIEKLMNGHNLRALYMEIHKVLPEFFLDKGALSMLKDFYYDAKYPGDNFVVVDRTECLETMYETIRAVNEEREKLELPVEEFEERYLEE